VENLLKRAPFLPNDFAILAIVLALPLLGAFVNGVFGKRLGKPAVRLMALAALGGSFLASVLTFASLMSLKSTAEEPAKLAWTAWTWLKLDSGAPLEVKFSVDAMSATMMLVVTGVGFLIHLYSSEYMKKDPGYYRFFSYLNLFCFSMLVLIMGDSLPVLFVGWEGVGLCSYLLIGFWFKEEKNASAGKKAFIANRIGDFGLLVAMALLLAYGGRHALDWDGIRTGSGGLHKLVTVWPIGNLPDADTLDAKFPAIAHWPGFLHDAVKWLLSRHDVHASTLVGLALFLGCAGKSAQIPLYVWLPDAMAGPTPVSALIHAATMVTAGVYLVARMSFVFVMSPAAMATVAVVGAATAIFAASMGLLQKDLKKVLAYSTVSQLGFMFIGVGMGAFVAGFFHVFTHAFFKACLFLGAGSVIHSMHARIHDTDASQDMSNMGGLRKYMPTTHITFLVSCLSIAGAPLLAGFWSKDEILWKAFSSEIHTNFHTGDKLTEYWVWPSWLGPAIYWVGIAAATMTAFYMFRAYFMTFWGEFRGWKIVQGWKDPHKGKHHHHDHEEGKPKTGPTPHESPWQMTLPLVILGVLAVGAGFLGAEPFHIAPLTHRLEQGFEGLDHQVVARTGLDTKGSTMWLMMAPGFAAFVIGSGLAYLIYVVRKGEPEREFAANWPRTYKLIYDKWRIDELYDATVIGMVDALADIFVMADTWIVDGVLAKLSALIVKATGSVLRLFQTGRVQVYAASMVIGLVGIGWFLSAPHASYTLDDKDLQLSGKVVVHASSGLGYSYKWSGDGIPAEEFSSKTELQLSVDEGKSKTVTLEVKNAFGRQSKETITVARPPRTSKNKSPFGAMPPTGGDAPMMVNPQAVDKQLDNVKDQLRKKGGAQ